MVYIIVQLIFFTEVKVKFICFGTNLISWGQLKYLPICSGYSFVLCWNKLLCLYVSTAGWLFNQTTGWLHLRFCQHFLMFALLPHTEPLRVSPADRLHGGYLPTAPNVVIHGLMTSITFLWFTSKLTQSQYHRQFMDFSFFFLMNIDTVQKKVDKLNATDEKNYVFITPQQKNRTGISVWTGVTIFAKCTPTKSRAHTVDNLLFSKPIFQCFLN